jgi:hypothetical protein
MESIKRHSSYPYLEFGFTDDDGGVIDCTIYDIRLVVKNIDNEIVINCVVGEEGSSAVWDEEALGTGYYEWQDADTQELGTYRYEFKFTRIVDGETFVVPKKGFYGYRIIEDIPIPEVT